MKILKSFVALIAEYWIVTLIITCVLVATTIGVYVGIQRHSIKEGVIVDKGYQEPYTESIFIPVTVSTGNGQSSTILVPYTVYHPGYWFIKIRGTQRNGKVGTRTLETNAYNVNSHEIGEYLVLTQDFNNPPQPVKERVR